MRYSYCTLFDNRYLAKGMLLCESFLKNTDDSWLYVLSMDEKTYNVLSDLNYERVTVILLDDFLSDTLIEVMSTRTRAEFCWTCTASLIKYVLCNYSEEVCTYIDSDMFFYNNPDELVVEMLAKGKSVQIIPHGFSKMLSNRFQEKASGKYCVEFNTFKNDEAATKVLDSWITDTLAECEYGKEGKCGDQYYLNEWPQKYECVNILSNLGAGVAPWNVDRYKNFKKNGKTIEVLVDGAMKSKLYFYHFHGITDMDDNTFDIHVFRRYLCVDKNLVLSIYYPYLRGIICKRKELNEKYGIDNKIYIHPAIEEMEQSKKQIKFDEFLFVLSSKIKAFLNRKKDIITIADKNISKEKVVND